MSPEHFYQGITAHIPHRLCLAVCISPSHVLCCVALCVGEGVTDDKGMVVVKRVASAAALPHVTSSSTLELDGSRAFTITTTSPGNTSSHTPVRPVRRIELDEKGLPVLMELDEVAAVDKPASKPLLPLSGANPPPLSPSAAASTEREPALDDEYGGRDPNAAPPGAARSKKTITHTQALTHLYKAYKSSEEYRALGLELWAMDPNFVDPKKREPKEQYNGSFFLQVWLCFMRQIQIVWRNKVRLCSCVSDVDPIVSLVTDLIVSCCVAGRDDRWLLPSGLHRPACGYVRHRSMCDRSNIDLTRQFLSDPSVAGSLFWDIGVNQKDARTRFGLFFFMLSFNAMGAVQAIPAIMEQRLVYYSQTDAGYYRLVKVVLLWLLFFDQN